METKKILLGFNPDKAFEDSLKKLLGSVDCMAEIIVKTSKESIRDKVRKTPDLDAVVVLETLPSLSRTQKRQKYEARELAALAEDSNANIIAVLSENHKGTDYMRVLLSAGITCALFVNAKKGVDSKDVATMIMRKRTKSQARAEYQVSGDAIDLGFLENDAFNELYAAFQQRSGTPIQNYLYICKNLVEARKIADFTRRLPKEDVDYLAAFQEFHAVIAFLGKEGFEISVEKPEVLKVGLARQAEIGVRDGSFIIDIADGELGGEALREEPVKKEKGGFAGLFGRKKGAEKGVVEEEKKKAEKRADEKKIEETATGKEQKDPNMTPQFDFGSIFPDRKPKAAVDEAIEKTDAGTGQMEPVAEIGAKEPKKEEPKKEKPQKLESTPFVSGSSRGQQDGSVPPQEKEQEEKREEEKMTPPEEKIGQPGQQVPEDDFGGMSLEDMIALLSGGGEEGGEPEEKPKEAPTSDPEPETPKKETAKEEPKEEAPKKEIPKEEIRKEKREEPKAKPVKESLPKENEREPQSEGVFEFPGFDDMDGVELHDTNGGKGGIYLIVLLILIGLLGGIWYLNGGGNFGFEIPGF